MAEEYTPYQKRAIRRFYDNREDKSHQRLSEIVSELYLCTSEKKATSLWKQAESALRHAGANEAWLAKVVAEKNVAGLAELVQKLF